MSRPLGRIRVPPGAKRLRKMPMLHTPPGRHLTPLGAIRFLEPLPNLFRLAGSHFLLGAMRSKLLWFSFITWQHTPSRQAAHPKPLGATSVTSLLLVFGTLKQVLKNPKHYTYNPLHEICLSSHNHMTGSYSNTMLNNQTIYKSRKNT